MRKIIGYRSCWGPDMVSRILAVIVMAASAVVLGACVTTSMQGYADLQPPAHPIQHIAAIAPPALIPALANEASKRGVAFEDANVILPPTRQYNETEIRQAMAAHGIDGVLVVNVTGDTGVQERYAGTIANTSYTGTSTGNATVMGNMIYGTGVSSGTATTTSTPIYHYRRAVGFEARLSDPQTSRKFWVGSGQTQSGGSLFVGDAVNAANAASSIFNDLQTKDLIGSSGA
jgi:hypothetical protein